VTALPDLPAPDADLVRRLSDTLSSILPGRPIALAYLYGSAASGLTTPFSDVDIALLASEPLASQQQLRLELRLEPELAERAGVPNADVRIINDLPLLLRGQVACRGVLLYCADEATRIEFETVTRDEYFDFLPIAEQIQCTFLDTIRERGLYG